MLPDAFHAKGRQASVKAGWVVTALLLAALTLYLAFHSGGFFPGAASLAATEVAIAIVACLVLTRHPFEGVSLPLGLAVVALGGLAAWTLLSANWSDSMARALPEYTRALLYGLTLVFFGLLPFDAKRVRWMLYAFAMAVVAICAAGLIARLLPHVILDPALAEKDRLGYPLTYWNSLGLVAGIGIVLCGHLSCSTRDPWPARILGATSVPLLTLTLYYTLSRGAMGATLLAVAAYAVAGRPRALLSGAVATAPTTLAILIVANPPDALTTGNPAGAAAVASGKHVALVLVACMLAAAAIRLALLRLDRWLVEFRLPRGARRPVLGGAVATLVVAALIGSAALNVPHAISAKYGQLTNRHVDPGGGSSRLLSASTDGRLQLWDVSLAAFRHDRLDGSGAGTYPLQWNRFRPGSEHVLNAHSVYLEVLGELGIVGFLLLVAALALIVGAFAYRARGPDRALFAALLAASLAWVIHAGVDWDWQMPAVTLWLFAFGGAALARSPRERHRPGRIRTSATRIVGVLACLGVAILPTRIAVSQARLNSALGELKAGDCPAATRDARSALSAVGERPTPYVVMAYCEMRQGHYRAAVGAMRQALRRDPRNWELYYDLAVARAGAGLDPRRPAHTAALLNPHGPIARSAPNRFRGNAGRDWERAANAAPLVPPGPGDP